MQRVELAAVGVNKAADYYYRADEVLPPRPPQPAAVDAEPVEVDEATLHRGPAPRPAPPRPPKLRTTLDRLRQQETALDDALGRSFERFSRGEITAREMDEERDRLIEAFNRQVMNENIRYRSMLRRRPSRAR